MFATLRNEDVSPVQIKPPALSRAEVVLLDDEETVVRGEASPVVKLCLERSPSLVYEEREPPVLNVQEVISRKRKLSSPMTSIGK